MTSTAMARCGKLATTLGPAAASPLPLYPRFAAYPGCLRACRNSSWGGPSISEEVKRNTTGALVRAVCIGGRRPWRRLPSRTLVSLRGPLDPTSLSGVTMIKTTLVSRDDRTSIVRVAATGCERLLNTQTHSRRDG